jgi:WD40 repeat protein
MYIKYFILTLVTLLVACSPVPETTETPAGSYDRTINLATNPPPSTPPPEVDQVVLQLGHSDYVSSVAFSPDGKTALSGSDDNTVKWWDLESGRVINSLEAHSSRVYSVAFSPDGKTALSGSDDHTTRLWNLSTGEEIIRLVGFKDGEGVAIMPQQGYYVASPKGEKYINVSFGNRAVGIEGYEKYKKFYHRPDILKLAWQLGNAERAIALANKKRR